MRRLLIRLLLVGGVVGLGWLSWLRFQDEAEEKAIAVGQVAVQVAPIVRSTVRKTVVAYGRLESEPAAAGRVAAQVRLIAPIDGLLAEVLCFEGQQVKKGTLLFRLDDRLAKAALDKARANVSRAKQALRLAETRLTRQQTLLQQDNTAVQTFQQAEAEQVIARTELATARAELVAAETQHSLLAVRAPMSGTVMRVSAHRGEVVAPATLLAELIDLDRLVVAAGVPSVEAASVRLGQPAEIDTDQPSRPIVGTVAFISPDADSQTGTRLVRISVPPGASLPPGQIVQLRIVVEERRDRLVVPVASVVKRGDKTVIAVVVGDTATLQPVTTGLRSGGDSQCIEIQAEGLREGMRVVTAGAYGLAEETQVRVLDQVNQMGQVGQEARSQ